MVLIEWYGTAIYLVRSEFYARITQGYETRIRYREGGFKWPCRIRRVNWRYGNSW